MEDAGFGSVGGLRDGGETQATLGARGMEKGGGVGWPELACGAVDLGELSVKGLKLVSRVGGELGGVDSLGDRLTGCCL